MLGMLNIENTAKIKMKSEIAIFFLKSPIYIYMEGLEKELQKICNITFRDMQGEQ